MLNFVTQKSSRSLLRGDDLSSGHNFWNQRGRFRNPANSILFVLPAVPKVCHKNGIQFVCDEKLVLRKDKGKDFLVIFLCELSMF